MHPPADGMVYTVEPAAADRVVLRLSGLQPGESLILLFSAESPTHKKVVELPLPDAVAADGRFAYEESLSRLPDATENTWTVKVIHSRGVACQDVTLP